MSGSIFDFKAKDISGNIQDFKEYEGSTLLIVNVASECGFTKQYEGLQELYNEYNSKNLKILGFPCNQFGGQEPGSDKDIYDFCVTHFMVSFPMFSKIEVNGENADPIFKFLKTKAPGLMGTEAIKWNFTKFLVSKDGKTVKRFAPKDTPQSIKSEIEKVL